LLIVLKFSLYSLKLQNYLYKYKGYQKAIDAPAQENQER